MPRVHDWLEAVIAADLSISTKVLAVDVYPRLLRNPPHPDALKVSEEAIRALADN